jgi:hypothetical protein
MWDTNYEGCRSVVVRTHGGLGNQLFQVLYARLFATHYGIPLFETHDDRYAHKFSRTKALKCDCRPPIVARALSALRIPKIRQKLTHEDELPWVMFGSVFLDGYFQEVQYFRAFAPGAVARELSRMKQEIGVGACWIDVPLVHLRLGDFFVKSSRAKWHAFERLREAPRGAIIITNDEDVVSDPAIRGVMLEREVSLFPTSGLAAEDVLRFMSRHRRIIANDSTLTFWASVFGGSEVEFRDPVLKLTQEFFRRCGAV